MATCPNCGESAPGKFCKNCGTAMPAPPSAPPPPPYCDGPGGPDPALGFKRALEQGECTECFDRLCKDLSGALFCKGQRSCPHYFHCRCAYNRMATSMTCRVCNAAFDEVRPFPDVRMEPMNWFKFVDFDQDEKLSKTEVLEALKAALNVDPVVLMETMPGQWKSEWDKNRDGCICIEEFVSPQGLLAYVEANMPPAKTLQAPVLTPSSKQEWFHFWDVDRSSTLEREEVVRALIKTFQMSENLESVANMRTIVEETWCIFDTDGSGSVDMREFCMTDGLGDTVMATQQRHG